MTFFTPKDWKISQTWGIIELDEKKFVSYSLKILTAKLDVLQVWGNLNYLMFPAPLSLLWERILWNVFQLQAEAAQF